MIPYETNQYGDGLWAKLSRRPTWLGLLVLGLLLLVFLFLLFVVILLLPPVSLLTRLDPAYVSIDGAGGDIQDPDGMLLTFPSEGIQGPVRVKLTPIPRSLFLEGTVDNRLLAAAQSIPPNLVMKTPYYQIQYRGAMPQAVIINMPIPNEAEPYHTLDLYSWNGAEWEWLPSRQIAGEEMIESKLNYLPQSIVAMQTQAAKPAVSAIYAEGEVVPGPLRESELSINPQGLYLETDGLVPGHAAPLSSELSSSAKVIVPIIRNWHDDGAIRSDLIDNLLISDSAREQHINVILNLIQSNGYDGIGLDYREISPDLRQQYSAFLRQLRATLPSEKQLLVYVAPPVQISADTWETGAYDWQAIGRLADAVLLPTPTDPEAYEPGGQTEALLDWAVGRINRYKVQLYFSTYSVDQAKDSSRRIPYEQALENLGTAGIVGGVNTVPPGQIVDFTLSGLPTLSGIEFHPESGLYAFTYLEGDTSHTVYLENAASLARKLQFVVQYNLRGVTVQNLFHPSNDPQLYEVAHQFLNLFIPPVEGHHAVVWRVINQEGSLLHEEVVNLTSPAFKWMAPAEGTYQIIAAISPNGDPATITPLGSVPVTVAAP